MAGLGAADSGAGGGEGLGFEDDFFGGNGGSLAVEALSIQHSAISRGGVIDSVRIAAWSRPGSVKIEQLFLTKFLKTR